MTLLAFADDLLLMAASPVGLQRLLDDTSAYLGRCGLKVNATKCFTVSVSSVPGANKSVIDGSRVFTCDGRVLPALKRSEQWRYLGVPFTPEGRLACRPADSLRVSLEVLTKAPLKPQQRLFALRCVVLPGLYHLLVLGKVSMGLLRGLDVLVRKFVRRWLALPKDVPNAYVHADYRDGGVSIPSLRWVIPLQRFNRLSAIGRDELGGASAVAEEFRQGELSSARHRLDDGQGMVIKSLNDVKRRWARQLHRSQDGGPLKESGKVPTQHRWVVDGTRFLTGRDFVNAHRLRINAQPLRVRMARGRVKERGCRAGCHDAETLHHVLQTCHRTHRPRVQRHDACVKYLSRPREGREVAVEPHFRTQLGLLKPDLIFRIGSSAVVVDAQVVGERSDLNALHRRKSEKYECLEEPIRRRYNADNVIFSSLTVSARGVWSSDSASSLVNLGILRVSELKVISTRVLVGGLHILRVFNGSTRMGFGPAGIG